MRYNAHWDGYNLNKKQKKVADINLDNEIGEVDYYILTHYLAGWDIT